MYGPTTITTKGQVTIPEEIRRLLNAHPGDKAIFTPVPHKNQVLVNIVSNQNAVEELYGSLHVPGIKYVPLSKIRSKVYKEVGKHYQQKTKEYGHSR